MPSSNSRGFKEDTLDHYDKVVKKEIINDIYDLTAKINEDSIEELSQTAADKSRTSSALLSTENVESSSLARILAEVNIDIQLSEGEEPLLIHNSVREYAEHETNRKIKNNRNLEVDDLSILDIYNTSRAELHTINDRIGVEQQDLRQIDEKVRNHMAKFGIEVDAPENIKLEKTEEDWSAAEYDDNRGGTIILGKNSYFGQSVLGTWIHELQHRKNKQLKEDSSEYFNSKFAVRDEALAKLVGYQFKHNDEIRDPILNENQETFESHIDRALSNYDDGHLNYFAETPSEFIKKEIMEWKDTYDSLEGSPGEKFDKMITEETMTKYLKEGYIPSPDELET